MFKITNLLVVALTVGLPLTVQAQPGSVASDRAYCARLSETYVRYIGHDDGSSRRLVLRGSNDAQVASTQCKTNTAWAIPVLEQQLAANKFTLPTRD
jgi:hypothetical protein